MGDFFDEPPDSPLAQSDTSTTRNPSLLQRFSGNIRHLASAPQPSASLPQPPPRIARKEQIERRRGSPGIGTASTYSSAHPSHTFPCMSCSLAGIGTNSIPSELTATECTLLAGFFPSASAERHPPPASGTRYRRRPPTATGQKTRALFLECPPIAGTPGTGIFSAHADRCSFACLSPPVGHCSLVLPLGGQTLTATKGFASAGRHSKKLTRWDLGSSLNEGSRSSCLSSLPRMNWWDPARSPSAARVDRGQLQSRADFWGCRQSVFQSLALS